jgi:hypothetical protein
MHIRDAGRQAAGNTTFHRALYDTGEPVGSRTLSKRRQNASARLYPQRNGGFGNAGLSQPTRRRAACPPAFRSYVQSLTARPMAPKPNAFAPAVEAETLKNAWKFLRTYSPT